MVKGLRAMVAAALVASGEGGRRYLPDFPNGEATGRAFSLGHYGVTPGAVDKFGDDWIAAGRQWTAELCNKDSDGDSISNGEELGDGNCDGTPDRTDNLSDPGDPTSQPQAVGGPGGAPTGPGVSPSPGPAPVPAPGTNNTPPAGTDSSVSPVVIGLGAGGAFIVGLALFARSRNAAAERQAASIAQQNVAHPSAYAYRV